METQEKLNKLVDAYNDPNIKCECASSVLCNKCKIQIGLQAIDRIVTQVSNDVGIS